MLSSPWTINETQIHITLQTQAVVKPLGVSMATAAVCICGVSSFKYTPRKTGGMGKKISPCGFIPLVSPGFHNAVERNEQVMSLVHGIMGETGCKLGSVG